MKILPKKLMRVSDRVVIPVSQYFAYSTFGVLGNYVNQYHYINFLCDGTVGTGFFVRDTESQSYQDFCREFRKKIKPNYWRFVTGREFSFKKEMKRVHDALTETDDPIRRRILDTYFNCLTIAKDEEVMERIVASLRYYIKGRPNKKLTGPLKHYKNRIAALEHEIRLTQLNVKDSCNEEQHERFGQMARAFNEMCSVRRIWDLSVPGKDGHRHKQIFWDLGMFDFIQSAWYLPMMRDGKGMKYFILPTYLIRVRSSVDFDLIPLSKISMLFHPVGDGTQADINIPELGLAFRFSNIAKVESFHKAFDALKEVQ